VKEWPFNGFINQYDGATWQYARTKIGDQGRTANTAQSGETPGTKSGQQPHGAPGTTPGTSQGPPFDNLVKSLVKPAPLREYTSESEGSFPNPQETLLTLHAGNGREDHRCPKETFLKVTETILANSGVDRTTSFAYDPPRSGSSNGSWSKTTC